MDALCDVAGCGNWMTATSSMFPSGFQGEELAGGSSTDDDCPLDIVYEIVADLCSRAPALLDDGWVCTSVVVAIALRTGMPKDFVFESLDFWETLVLCAITRAAP